MIGVSRELTRRARARIGVFAALPVTDDFVTVVCDPSQGKDGEVWLRCCVDEPLFSAPEPLLVCRLLFPLGAATLDNTASRQLSGARLLRHHLQGGSSWHRAGIFGTAATATAIWWYNGPATERT